MRSAKGTKVDAINSWSGWFLNTDIANTNIEYEPGTKEWKNVYKKLDSKDKKIVDDVMKDVRN